MEEFCAKHSRAGTAGCTATRPPARPPPRPRHQLAHPLLTLLRPCPSLCRGVRRDCVPRLQEGAAGGGLQPVRAGVLPRPHDRRHLYL